MTAQLFQCPSCGAPVTPRGSAKVLNCPYCNASVVVPEELRQVSNAASWSTLVYDGFISNHNEWMVGNETSKYFTPLNRTIAEGRYRWEAQVGTGSSIASAWLTNHSVADFHLIANCKHIRGSRGGSSWGVIFRIQDNQNFYHFRITDQTLFSVTVQKDGQWLDLVDWTRTTTIKPNGVNQLEAIAHQKHFTFLINGQTVSELDDDHFSEGMVGLSMEGYARGEEIAFDFMDIIVRAP